MRYFWLLLFPTFLWAQPPTGRILVSTNGIPIGIGLGIDFTRGVTGYAFGPYFKLGSSVESLTNNLIQTNGANLGSPNTVNYTRGLTGFVAGAVGNIGVSLADTNQLIQTNGVTLGSAGTVNWNNGVTGFLSGAVATLGVSSSSGGGGTNFDGIRVTNTIFFPNPDGGFSSELDVNNNTGPVFNDGTALFSLNFEEGFVEVGASTRNGVVKLGDATAGVMRSLLVVNSSDLEIGDPAISTVIRGDTNSTIGSISFPFQMMTTFQVRNKIFTNYINTVSNFVFSFETNRYELKNQTNIVFTNLVEEATAIGSDIEIHIHNTTGVTMGLVWPAYGAQHGYYFQTNVISPILSRTSLGAGQHGRATFKAFGTNIFASYEVWP